MSARIPRRLPIALLCALLAACGGENEIESTPTIPQPMDDFCSGSVSLSSDLPRDVAQDPGSLSPAQAQTMFDCFSWRSFVAVNWPASSTLRGAPEASAPITTTGPRVWETYKEVYELFQAQNAAWDPSDQSWNAPPPAIACSDVARGRKVVRRFSKVPRKDGSGVVNEYEQAFATGFGTLTDQNGNLVRYEVRYNRDEFEFIKRNGFAKTGNYDFGGPTIANLLTLMMPDNKNGATGVGAIEVKGSWRELTATDDAARYYSEDVVIFDPADTTMCRSAQLGLVGLHIAHKTAHAPQWAWSTFEHVDNVPPPASVGSPLPGTTYSFFDAACAPAVPADCWSVQPPLSAAALRCCPNAELNPRVFPEPPFAHPGTPNQVTRIDAIGPVGLNEKFQRALAAAGSRLQFYQLIGTQWPSGARNPDRSVRARPCNPNGTFPFDPVSSNCYTMVPANLRNTSMETYMVTYALGTNQLSSDSCMGCHGTAGVDFSYIWLDASTLLVPIVQ